MLRRGDTVEIQPNKPLCKQSSQTVWKANVLDNELYGYYPIEFHNRQCPPETDDLGNPLVWWLTAITTKASSSYRWVLRASLATAPESPLTQYNYDVAAVRGAGGVNIEPLSPKNKQKPERFMPAISVSDAMSESDLRLQRKIIQDQMFGQIKPPLVRTVLGGRNSGLGIRDVPETDLRREWLQLPVGGFVSVQINITDASEKLITTTTLHGKIIVKHDRSALLNGLGMVFEFDPDRAVGDTAEIAAYTPVFIGRRKIKYWLCIYYDLRENKVIATSSLVNYDEIVKDASTGGSRSLVLAEYAIGNIALSTEGGTAVPFEADQPDSIPVPTTSKIEEAPIDTPAQLAPPPQAVAVEQRVTDEAQSQSTLVLPEIMPIEAAQRVWPRKRITATSTAQTGKKVVARKRISRVGGTVPAAVRGVKTTFPTGRRRQPATKRARAVAPSIEIIEKLMGN
jgi:hypothetical protein